jgi:hypothetical protein
MTLRGHIAALKRMRDRDRQGFRLADGKWFSYDFEVEAGNLFVYCIECMAIRAEAEPEPEEPYILQMIRQAEDPDASLAPFRPDNPERAFVDIAVLLHPELAEREPETLREEIPDLSDGA